MHSAFENISMEGLIRPGEMYLVDESRRTTSESGPIEYLCVIRHDEEILPALDMEMCIVREEDYDLLAFLDWRALDADCYEFRMLCYLKDEDRVDVYSIYLHRVMPFYERLEKVKELFGKV